MKANEHPLESRRLEVLRLYRVLDTASEQVFDELAELAAAICGAPIAMISLIDEHRQWFKARVGMAATETPRDIAFCAHAILEASVFTVNDATKDERFATNPLVTTDPHVRFYAGTPLLVEEGLPLGMLCVMDRRPRHLSPMQEESLRRLGHVVVSLLDVRRRVAEMKELEALLSMCSSCRRVRDQDGRWQPLEAYVMSHEPVSHGMCPDCVQRDFPREFAKLFAPGAAPPAAAVERAPSASSPYGVNAHLAGDDVLEQLRQAGIGWVRLDVGWHEVERSRGQLEWTEIDRALGTAERLGLSVLASVAYAPPWATHDGRSTGSPREPALWRGFVEAFLERHAPRLAAVSFANEPNLEQFYTGTREEYLRDILLPGLAAAEALAPGVLRCGPDLSSSPGGGDPLSKWLGPVLQRAGARLDVITHHQYDGHDSVSGRVKEIEKLHAFLSGRGATQPLWITEIGWDTRSGASPAAQAVDLRGTLHEMRARSWWAKTFWYDSHGEGWGLLEPDGSPLRGQPRPAYQAYREETGGGAAPSPRGEDARVVVEHAYRGILAREPDRGGLEAYTRALDEGTPVALVCRALAHSPEFEAQRAGRPAPDLALDLYRGILEREPDPQGREETLAAVSEGRLDARAAEMLQSGEFAERFLARTGR